MITSSNSLYRGAVMPNQVHGVLLSRHVRVPSCPGVPNRTYDCEYSQPFRHIQYNLIAIRRPIATLQCSCAGASPGACSDVASRMDTRRRFGPPHQQEAQQGIALLADVS